MTLSIRTRIRLTAGIALLAALAASAPAATAQQVITLPAPPTSSARTAGMAQPAVPSNGLMWKAASGTHTAWMVGSVHFGTPEMYPLPQAMEDAFSNSSVLIVELDSRELLNPAKVQGLLAATGMYPAGDSLSKHLAPETRALLTRFCAEHGLLDGLLDRFKPWLAALMVTAAQLQAGSVRPELGIDLHFLDQAKSGKRIEQLESVEQQMKMLAGMPEQEQEKALGELLKNPDRMKDTFYRLQKVWLAGDAAAMEKLVELEFQAFPGEEKSLLSDRNPHMADAIDRCLKGTETCFMVVGAGHLVGEKGIVSLLKRRGYRVEQVLANK